MQHIFNHSRLSILDSNHSSNMKSSYTIFIKMKILPPISIKIGRKPELWGCLSMNQPPAITSGQPRLHHRAPPPAPAAAAAAALSSRRRQQPSNSSLSLSSRYVSINLCLSVSRTPATTTESGGVASRSLFSISMLPFFCFFSLVRCAQGREAKTIDRLFDLILTQVKAYPLFHNTPLINF